MQTNTDEGHSPSGTTECAARVELNEGPRIVAQMTDCEAGELRIGLEVDATFRRIYEDDFMIRYGIKFRPVRKSGPV